MVEIDSPAVKQGRVPQQQQPLPSRHRRQSRRMAQIKAAIRIQASWRGYSGRSGGAAYVARCAAPAVLRPLSAHALCLSVSVRIHRGAVGSIKSSVRCDVCVCVCCVQGILRGGHGSVEQTGLAQASRHRHRHRHSSRRATVGLGWPDPRSALRVSCAAQQCVT